MRISASGQRHVAELLLERLGVIALDHVLAGQLEDLVALDGRAEACFQVGPEQALAGAAADEVDDLLIAARLGGDAHRDAGMAPADAQVAVLDHDRQRLARRVPALAVAAQSADGAQQLQLIDVALLGAVDLGQVVEHLVGQFGGRHAFQDGAEDGAGLLAVAAPAGQHAAQELRPDDHVALPAAGQALERQLGLVVDLLLHEGLADAELGLDRLRRLGVAVQNGRVLGPGQVVALAAEVVAGQQQLHPGLLDVLDFLRFAVLDQPAAQDVLGSVELLIAAGGAVALADEQQQIDRHLGAVVVEQLAVGHVAFEGQLLVAQAEVQGGLKQWSDGALVVDGGAGGAETRIGLGEHVPARLAATLIDAVVGEHAADQGGRGDVILAGHGSLGIREHHVPVLEVAGSQQGRLVQGEQTLHDRALALLGQFQQGNGRHRRGPANLQIAEDRENAALVGGIDLLVVADSRDPD